MLLHLFPVGRSVVFLLKYNIRIGPRGVYIVKSCAAYCEPLSKVLPLKLDLNRVLFYALLGLR